MGKEYIFPRRTLLAGLSLGTALLLSKSSEKIVEPPKPEPFFSSEAIKSRIQELYKDPIADRDIISVLEGGNVSYMKPFIYNLPAKIEAKYGDKCITNTKLFIPEPTTNAEVFPGVHSVISFSKDWYEMYTPVAQIMGANFAARQVLQMPAFNRYQYKKLAESGELIPPMHTENEERIFATKFGLELIKNDPRARTLYTHAPYLHMMAEYNALGDEMSVDLKRDLDVLIPEPIRIFANNFQINNEELIMNMSKYSELAFGENEWTDFVLNL